MAMNRVAKLLSADDILLDVDIADKESLLENISQFFEWRHSISATLIHASLRAREDLGSTAVGHHIAIPHTRIKGLNETRGAFMRLQHAIDFDAPDDQPVSMALILLVPEHFNKEHLETLAAAAKMFSNKRFREKIQSCNTPAKIYQLFVDGPDV
jgi:PTS system nitrogen regulatory IIA component